MSTITEMGLHNSHSIMSANARFVHMPVEGVIGGSVCTHLGAEATTSPQTDTERFASIIIIYCPPGAQMRHLATNTHPANGGR